MVRLGCAAVLFAAIFYPSFDMSGRFYVNTAFGDISARITAQTDPAKVHYLDEEEREFVNTAFGDISARITAQRRQRVFVRR